MAQKPKKSEDKKTENIEKAKASLSPSEKEILHSFYNVQRQKLHL